MTEIWKAHPRYEGYEVSTLGRIRSWRFAKGRRREPWIMQGYVNRHGYREIHIRGCAHRQLERVHTMVLETFRGPCPPGMEGLHGPDPDTLNNELSNLRWGTKKENAADRDKCGRTARGLRNGSHTCPEMRPTGLKNGMHTKPWARRSGLQNGKYTKPERTPRGDTHGRTKVPDYAVPDIVFLRDSKMSFNEIALLYGVSPSTIERAYKLRAKGLSTCPSRKQLATTVPRSSS